MTTTAPGRPGLDAAAVAAALAGEDCGEVAGDAGRRAQYSADASNYRQIPLAVVFPCERRHVLNALAVCRRLGVPVTSRGAGTSTSGQAVGAGVVLDFSRHFNRLLALDPQERTATVQPGIVLDDLQSAAFAHGLLFGADPSTHSRCTLGGMIGNNACGSHSLAWGRTADNVLELEVVTYRGTVVRLGEMTQREIDEAIAAGDDRGQLIASLHRLAQDNLAALRTKLGQFPRQVSGYALEHLLPERRFNLARALVGSEGTLAVVLSATVRLISPPPARALVVLGFQDAGAAADAVPALLDHELLALEGLDQALTDIVTRPETRATIDTLPTARAWLFAELGGTAEELSRRANELTETARQAAGCTGSEIVTDPARARRLWRIREDGAGLATRMPDGSEAWPGWEDAAVPPGQLGSYLRQFTRLLDQHDLRGAVYGHFGEGCLHVRIDFDFTTEQGTAVFRAFVTDAAKLVTAHGGSLSGEHGDGQARSELLPLMYGPEVIALFEEFKEIWDPDNGLNPGMIVRPLPVDGNLRVSAHRTPLPLVSSSRGFAFHADDGDFAKATRRCVGVGKCRTAAHRGDVMCPSYRVTLDEKDSTRGRARLLYEMTQGEVITDGWRSTEVRDALDLCLSCKGCSADCPVEVDMATYKSEFLYHHYKGRVRPASHYTMGWLPLLSRAAARMPRLVNALTSSRLAPLLKRLGGIDGRREIPRFADETFLARFRRRTPKGDGHRGPVMLWVDSFNNHFTPEVLEAGVAVLEDAGFRVQVPDGTQCCGLTWITTGQLGIARRMARRTVNALASAADSGTPVVGLEPSCTAALKTDLPELLDGDDRARALAAATVTLAELLVRHAPDWQPPRIDARSISQTHCHQHATSGFGADSALLHRMGVDNTTIASGCCGLAGNFGFERGHYDVSVAAGEQVLLPAVRSAAPGTHVLADGFSCRTQIAQQTDRTGTHLAQLIARALPPATELPATDKEHIRD
ncbi:MULTISPECIES: FAD-binding and (Fe-S)-binding domain-containing protein [unclassified Streptomyces]|uniref:FAD-binding and (Fe-S)-binding domain-containing protein n=1 Tax=unclassified Streptomyces TaxID=2593676 RepID=UPI002366E6BE|nr:MULTISPECIES: FAD-binding and (Fe-S)-binding domain-containing protein [unclassified Streptomyces]MDF3141896.1 FAD-binding and (Fe-S)-binding domain-containing protein [Streptomyces sp. T21Q-yed]WDF39919.1 FAD-binding and (Fe-S)-binding domain-containing protein [Streptomyces sp. T12]